MKVFKYPISTSGRFSLEIPKGAKILTAQRQCNEPKIWALVDPKNKTETRYFILVDTGQSIEEKGLLDYIGTFQSSDGKQVDHLFEVE